MLERGRTIVRNSETYHSGYNIYIDINIGIDEDI